MDLAPLLLFAMLALSCNCQSPGVSSCEDGHVRLVDGSTPLEGRVEVCRGNVWGTVCDDRWSIEDAQVVCAQLGYRRDGATFRLRAYYGQGTGPIHMDNVECSGSEGRLVDCRHITNHNCRHNEDAGVQCLGACENGAVRLEDGDSEREGRVEVCLNNDWGTVCDDLWGVPDATVVCVQLGFSIHGAQAFSRAEFGRGSNSIWLDDVHCTGTELRLVDCVHDSNTRDCSHFEDASVRCNALVCHDGEVRLVGGSTASEGRVEVCRNEVWGTVCDDSWSDVDSTVVCRQLGLPTDDVDHSLQFGAGTGPILLDNVNCAGTESFLTNCSYDAHTEDCNHNEDVGVICRDIVCTTGEIRLAGIGRDSESEGRVEICVDNSWGLVCDDFWGSTDANVVCAQLGYSRFGAVAHRGAEYGIPEGLSILLDDVHCTGGERRLIDCMHTTRHNCRLFENAGVECLEALLCSDGEVRLSNGGTSGAVEVCWEETWGSVCDEQWTVSDALVTCQQLGFSRTDARPLTSGAFTPSTGPALLSNVSCTGSEAFLTNCSYAGLGQAGSCQHTVGVTCSLRGCSDWEVRVVGGSSLSEGRVEVCFNEQWGSVCDDFWDLNNARVVCSQLGLNDTTAIGYRRAQYGEGNGQIWLDDVRCSGTELSLQQCRHRPIGAHNCDHSEDAGVRCAQCSEYEVRLSGGEASNRGNVEVCLGGAWGSVCRDHWTDTEAAVVCAQLGLPHQGAEAAMGQSLGSGAPVWLSNVRCSGSEPRLTQCAHSTGLDCGQSTVAAVLCQQGPPAAPGSVGVVSITSTNATLTWTASAGNELQSQPEFYEINCTAPDRNIVATSADESVLHYSLTDLTPWTMYECCVRASSSRGFGESTCSSFQTLESPPSAPPESVQGFPVSSTSISLSWSPPAQMFLNGLLREYTVLIEVLDIAQVLTYITQESSIHISGLHPYYVHRCTVAASTVAPGPFSSPILVQTYQNVPSGPPQAVNAVATSTTTIMVSWSPPVLHHRNGEVIGYIFRVMEASNGNQQDHTINNQLSYTLSSLRVFTRYFISLAAMTVNGTGPYSSSIEVLTQEASPTRAPQNLIIDVLSSFSLSLEWSQPPRDFLNGIVRGYSVLVLEVETNSIVRRSNTTSSSLTLQGLHPNYSYQVQVACITVGVGPYAQHSVQMPIAAPSGSPTDIQISVSVDTRTPSAIVSWSPPPVDQQNGPIIQYSLEVTRLDNDETFMYTTPQLHSTLSSLMPNTVYSVVVRASTTAGSGPASEIHFFNTRTGVPVGSPRSLTVNLPVGSMSLTFSWLPVLPDLQNGVITGYILQLTELATGLMTQYNTTTTSFTVRNLHPYYQYTAKVAAFTENGVGPFTATFAQTTAQDVPTGYPGSLRAESVSSREVTLVWEPVAPSEANGIISEYELTVLNANSHESNTFTTTTLTATVTTLPYSTYLFSIAALTVVGRGPFSTEVLVETPEDAPSHHPQNVHIESIEARSLTLVWLPPPEDTHHGVIREYNVRVLDLQSNEELVLTSTTTRVTVTDLHPYYYYNCTVSAVTVEEGPHSAVVIARTAEDAPSGPPLGLQVVEVSARAAMLEWELPQSHHHNGVIRKYIIHLSDGSVINTTSRRVSIDGLVPVSSYLVQIAAFTISPGPFSTSIPFTTLEDVPESTPQNIVHQVTSSRTLSISWLPPLSSNGVITQYRVVLIECDTQLIRVKQVQQEQVNWIDLHPFYVYKYSIAASTAVGEGPFSQNRTIQMPEAAPAGPPLNIRVSEVGQTSVLVEWDPPPVVDRNGMIRHYSLSLTDSSGLDDDVTVNVQETRYSLMNLRAGNAYRVSVAAVTVDQGPSGQYLFTTLEDVPGPPIGVTVRILSSRSVEVSWTPPQEHLRNGHILHYVVRVELVSPPSNISPVEHEVEGLSITLSSLHPAWSYEFTVSAVTIVGRGEFTSVLGTLLEDAPSAAPRNFSWRSPSPSTLMLSWQPPPDEHHNGVILEYQLHIAEIPSGGERNWKVTGTSYLVEMLLPFYEYSCSIAAVTIAPGPSTSITIQQPEDVPGSPGPLLVNHTSPYSSLLQWSPVPRPFRHGVIIAHYVQALSSSERLTDSVGPNEFRYEFMNLESSTVYTFSVSAVTSAGAGVPSSNTTTTLLGFPSFTPVLSGVSRISPTEIEVTVETPPVQSSPDNQVSFLVRYREVEIRVARNIDDLATIVEISGAGGVINGLDPQLEYAVSVAAKNEAGVGDFSDEVVASVYDSSGFQLHLFGPIVCLPWIEIARRDKMDVVSQVVSTVLESSCNCSFSPKFIALAEIRCGDRSTDRLIFEASLVSTRVEKSSGLRGLVQDWVYTEPTVIIHGVQLQVAPCSVLPDHEILCYVDPTLPVVTAELEPQSGTLFSVIGAAAGSMVLLICITLVVILVVVTMKRRHSKKARRQVAVRNPLDQELHLTVPLDGAMGELKLDKPAEAEGDYYEAEAEHIYDEPSNCISALNFSEKILHERENDSKQYYTNVAKFTPVASGSTKPVAEVEYSEVGVPDKPGGQYSQLNVSEMPRLHYNNIGTSHVLENDYDAPPSRGIEFPQLKPSQEPPTTEDSEPSTYQPLLVRAPYENCYEPLSSSVATGGQFGLGDTLEQDDEYIKMSSPKH